MPSSWQERVLESIDEDGDGSGVRVGEGMVYAVRSKSDPMKVYYLMDLGWIQVCTCDGFRYRTDCSHVRKMFEERVDKG